jgi:uncharacterized Zn-finger protein
MSTASPAGAKTSVCTETGCDKSFVRAEHLARHRLNRKSQVAADVGRVVDKSVS